MAIELYKHNKVAYEKVEKMFETEDRVAVVHPTGSGKSFISLKWLYDNRDKKCLFLAPTYPICDQVVRHIQNNGLNMSDFPNLKFAIYPNVASLSEQFLDENHFDCVVLDEFHRCGAQEWGKGIDRLLSHNPSIKVLGVSATPIRYLDDNRNMAEELFHGNVASEISLAEAVAKGILPVPTYINAIYSFQDDIDKIQAKISRLKDDENKAEMQKKLNQAKQRLENAEGLSEIFKKHIPQINGKYIVFCKDVEHMKKMMEESRSWFESINPNIEMYSVSSYQKNEDNQSIIDKFEKSQSDSLKLLFSVEMLNEGLHVSDIAGVIMLRPTMSPIIYMQQLGRALSVGHNSEPIVFDIVNNVRCHDAIKDFYEDVKRIIKKPKEFPIEGGLGNNEPTDEFDETILERFKIFDEAKEFTDILTEINNDYNSFVQRIREQKIQELEFAEWLKSLSNEELYDYYANNEDVLRERKQINTDFFEGNIKAPLARNISIRLFQKSGFNKNNVPEQEFNGISELLLIGSQLYDDEIKEMLHKIFIKNIPEMTDADFEEKYRSLFYSSKLIETIEIEREKSKLLRSRTNKDVYEIVTNSESINSQLSKIKDDFNNGLITTPSSSRITNTLKGVVFSTISEISDFEEISQLLLNGANLYDDNIKELFKKFFKSKAPNITEKEMDERFDALFRSRNLVETICVEKYKANLIKSKNSKEIYFVILNNEEIKAEREKIITDFHEGTINRPLIGNISNAFRMVSTINKETILTVEFNEISQALIDGANLYDEDIKQQLRTIYFNNMPNITEEVFENKYQNMLMSVYLAKAIEMEKTRFNLVNSLSYEESYNHFASVPIVTAEKEKVSDNLKKGVFPNSQIADITKYLSGLSGIQKDYIPDSMFFEIREKLLSGIPLYSTEMKQMIFEVYRNYFKDASDEKIEEKYKNYLTNVKLIQAIEIENFKKALIDSLDYKSIYDLVKNNQDISSEKEKIDSDLSQGIIPILMARPINQAFRTGMFSEITERLLNGANLYDADIRDSMIEILNNNDFASADKTSEEKYFQLLKKEKLVRVIEIEKYKKSILDKLDDKQMYEVVRSHLDMSEETQQILNDPNVKPSKGVLSHCLEAVSKAKKLKVKPSELSFISDMLYNGANLYDEEVKIAYIKLVQEKLGFTYEEAHSRYRDKLSNPIVVRTVELEKIKNNVINGVKSTPKK